MAYEKTDDGSTADKPCPSAKDQLETVLKEIAAFEAKKLPELKTELDGFVKKQDGLVTDYAKQFPELKRLWCEQQKEIDSLHAQLKCTHDPTSDKWKSWIRRCICAKQREVACLATAIARRKRCCYGPNELARDRAKAKHDAAKATLDILLALLAKLNAALNDHKDWIKKIKEVPAAERATLLYLFWFRLLPAHRALMPAKDDLGHDCKVPGDDETPEKICKPYETPCPSDPGACTPPADDKVKEGDAGYAGDGSGRPVPWLMSAEAYAKALDCAWNAYSVAKNELALAEAAYKARPDDLTSRIRDYGAAKEALEANILACLKEYKPNDPCCGDADAQHQEGA